MPKTDAELFDMLHSIFGMGNFDEMGGVAWFKYRMNEIGKLKAIRKRRQVTLTDLAEAARFCHRHREHVGEMWHLCSFVPAARREAAANRVPDLTLQVEAAIACERALARPVSDAWLSRLLQARGPARKDVLQEWNQSKQGES